MAWSKKVMSYPGPLREMFITVMETGQPATFTFTTPREAAHFERMVFGLRSAFTADKDSSERYRVDAPLFTAETSDDKLTVRVCSVDDTKRGRLAKSALEQMKAQYKQSGVDYIFPSDMGVKPA